MYGIVTRLGIAPLFPASAFPCDFRFRRNGIGEAREGRVTRCKP